MCNAIGKKWFGKFAVLLMLCLFGSVMVIYAGGKKEAPAAQEKQAPAAQEKQAPKEVEKVKIMIAAAASLEKTFTNKLIPAFEQKNPGITVEGTYDASGKLQTQIEAGLPADLFFSAAPKQMNALVAGGFIDSKTVVNLLENQIVLIVPSAGQSSIASFQDLVQAKHPAFGDPLSVPVGQYSKEALTSLGLWDKVSPGASFGTNVTEVLQWVAKGSADAGIVYATDAALTKDVRVVAAAPEGSLKQKVIYPVALLSKSAHPTEAGLFLEFLKSEEAQKIFQSYGFKCGN